jgi:hypothetical protein
MWVRLLDAEGEIVMEAGLESEDAAFRYALSLLVNADFTNGGSVEWDGADTDPAG